jgi:hypothetical protein
MRATFSVGQESVAAIRSTNSARVRRPTESLDNRGMVAQIVDQFAPLGPKKQMFFLQIDRAD